MRMPWAVVLLGLVAAAPPSPEDGRRLSGPPSGPWNNDVRVFHLDPAGRPEQIGVFERAGVPTVARMPDGRLLAAFQHFPAGDPDRFDKIAVSFSSDEGRTWSPPETARFSGLPEGMMRPFDPTLVPLPDGRVRLYFTGNFGRRPNESAPAIYSAVSTNGVEFVFEPGVRFAVEGRMVIDCAVVRHQGVVHLYAPDNGAARGAPTPLRPGGPRDGARRETPFDRPRPGVGYHATSRDGLAFSRLDDVRVDGVPRWLGNAVSDGRQIVFWGTEDGGPPRPGGGGRGGLWRAVSRDGQTWRDARTIDGIVGADPGVVPLRDGGWLLLITSPPVRNEPPPRR